MIDFFTYINIFPHIFSSKTNAVTISFFVNPCGLVYYMFVEVADQLHKDDGAI